MSPAIEITRPYKAGWNTVLPAPYASLPFINYRKRVSRQEHRTLYHTPPPRGKGVRGRSPRPSWSFHLAVAFYSMRSQRRCSNDAC